MLLNARSDFRSRSTVLETNVGVIRDLAVSTLAMVLVGFALALVHSGDVFAVAGGLQEGVVSSWRQLPSDQAWTALAMKVGRPNDFGVAGPGVFSPNRRGRRTDLDGCPP
jgi:hypothetical protein